jgi:hypothetical protein
VAVAALTQLEALEVHHLVVETGVQMVLLEPLEQITRVAVAAVQELMVMGGKEGMGL